MRTLNVIAMLQRDRRFVAEEVQVLRKSYFRTGKLPSLRIAKLAAELEVGARLAREIVAPAIQGGSNFLQHEEPARTLTRDFAQAPPSARLSSLIELAASRSTQSRRMIDQLRHAPREMLLEIGRRYAAHRRRLADPM